MRKTVVRYGVVAACVAGLCLAAGLARAEEIMQIAQQAPGVAASSSYENMGNNEAVDTLSGNLNVTHGSRVGFPLNGGGALRPVRVYNTKDAADAYWEGVHYADFTDLWNGPLGVGWTLSYGRVFVRLEEHHVFNSGTPGSYETREFYFYQDGTGAEHRLYPINTDSNNRNWQGAAVEPREKWYFTADGSYLRARYCSHDHKWFLYFPDGSVREAPGNLNNGASGSIPSFVPPEQGGTGTALYVKNPHQHGWYVTKVTDRAGNVVNVTYNAYDASTQPYGGSIATVYDDSGTPRTITFAYDATTHLLTGITYGSKTEGFAYGTLNWKPPGATTAIGSPFLYSAQDAAGMQTLYRYTVTPDTGDFPMRAVLSAIYYPTGAVSRYEYAVYNYISSRWPLNPNQSEIESLPGLGVSAHTLESRAPNAPTETLNVLTWTWNRAFTPHPWSADYPYELQPVATRDPLGTETVHYFSSPGAGHAEQPGGLEVFTVRRKPGAPAYTQPPYSVGGGDQEQELYAYAVASAKRRWAFGDLGTTGDAHLCFEDWENGTQSGLRVVNNPNGRVAWTLDQERNGNSGGGPGYMNQPLWSRETASYGWDGYGHYSLAKTAGTPDPGRLRLAASKYDVWSGYNPSVPDEAIVYQLDHAVLGYEGEGSYSRDPSPPHLTTLAGKFRVTVNAYEATARGMLAAQRVYKEAETTVTFEEDTANSLSAPAASQTGSKYLEISRDAATGNIVQLDYSGGDTAGTYRIGFAWDKGMVAKMWRRLDASYYTAADPEWTRTIDDYGRITGQTDANGVAVSFTYDLLDRVTVLAPAGLEYATYAVYPTDTTTRDTLTWTTAHHILTYRGPSGFTPNVNDDVTGIDAGAAYVHYFFDDLGRGVKTRTLHPDSTALNPVFAETVAAYDALGTAFFASLPRKSTDAAPVWEEVIQTLAAAGSFRVYLPRRGTEACYDGAVSTSYSSGTCSHPFQALADMEPQYRPLWGYRPDGSKTGTAYGGTYGLDRTVTLYDIQGETGLLNSATVYTNNAFGQLTHVDAPVGADADYTYDEFGHLIGVNLVSGTTVQTRTFAYNALGHLTSAANPENGTTNYLKYDCIGNLVEAQDANGAAAAVPYKVKSVYDGLSRLVSTAQVNASTGALIQTLIENVYLDASTDVPNRGKLVTATSRQTLLAGNLTPVEVISQETFSYAGLNGRPSAVTQGTNAGGGGGAAPVEALPMGLTYDNYGQVDSQTLPDAGGTIGNAYAHGAVASRSLGAVARLAGLSYGAAGQLTKVAFDIGDSQQEALDGYGRPSGFAYMQAGVPGTLLWGNGSFYTGGAYAYDGAGNIASLAASATQTDAFKYDALSRLGKADVHRAGYTHAYSYTYDAFGNLTQRTEALAGTSLTLLASLTDVNNYGFGANVPSAQEATDYIQALAFGATVSAPGGVPNNRLATVQRGGVIGGVDTGITQSNATMVYDANGNLVDDGKFLYGYDALNRQTTVSDKASSGLLSEYAYAASGERLSAMQYDGVPGTPSVTDYARYLRDGAAVVWENRDSTGRQKSYLYAAGRMAFTKESYLVCGFGGLALQSSSPTLGAPQVTADASGLTATASFAISTVPETVSALEVRLVKGNSLVSAQRIDRPPSGWCGGTFVTFGGLPEGADYQLGLTALSRAGMAQVMPPKAYLVERLRLGLVKGRLAAWTARRIKDDAGITKEELAAGFALLAPAGAENFTATASAATGTTALAATTAAGDLLMPSNAASATVQGTAGTTMTLAAPSAISGGGIQPAGGIGGGCTRHAEYTYYAVDHLGTVRYTRTFDDTFTLLSASVHDYEPFGVEIPAQDACANTHRYTGQERDPETGNDNFHFRYFASSLGRFQKPDSIFDGAPNPQGWNLYTYVKGNPVNFNDPTGHLVGLPEVGHSWASGGITGNRLEHQQNDERGGGLGLTGAYTNGVTGIQKDDPHGNWSVVYTHQMFTPKDMSFQFDPAIKPLPSSSGQPSQTSTPVNNAQPSQTNVPDQVLKAIPVKPPPGAGSAIRWQLSKKSSDAGGWIVQEVNVHDPSGQLYKHYWEAWDVPKGSIFTSYSGNNPDWPYDDQFKDLTGWKVEASARYYDDVTLPSTFVIGGAGTSAGRLLSTLVDPKLPLDNATPPVLRTFP